MIRVGIVGIGGISAVHINGYRTVEGAKLVAAADIAGTEAKNYPKIKEDGVKLYTSLDQMLDNEELDVLDICTPTYLHMEMAKQALERGLHVICEKPMSYTTENTREVIELAKAKDRRFMIAHVVRFMKPYAYLRDVIKSGELGKPVHLMFRRLSSNPKWSFHWVRNLELSGGATIDLSIHDIDFVYSVFGEPVAFNSVYREYNGDDGYGLNDFITSNLIYEGFTVNVTGTFYNAEIPFTAEFVAVFENGYVELKSGKLVKNGEEINLDEVNNDDTGVNVKGAGAYDEEIQYFINCVKNGTEPSFVTPESSEAALNLAIRLRTEGKKI